jgi:hypothetical protein
MTSTNGDNNVGGYRKEVDQQKLGPALLIASSLILAIRTVRWDATTSDAVSSVEWDREVNHSVRIGRIVLSHLISRYPGMFQAKDVPWYIPTDNGVPK